MPLAINLDKNPAYPSAVEALKADGTIPRRVVLRQCRYVNNLIEHGHRTVKKRVCSATGYGPSRSREISPRCSSVTNGTWSSGYGPPHWRNAWTATTLWL